MRPPFIYFLRPIGMVGPIKIGCSKVPLDRLRTQMAWSPFPLEIIVTAPGTLAIERAIHDSLMDVHSHAEWFFAVPRVLAAVERVVNGVPPEFAFDLSVKRGSMWQARVGSSPARRASDVRRKMKVVEAEIKKALAEKPNGAERAA